MGLMNLLSAIIIGSGFAIGLGLQGYFMYKTVISMAILKTAPNVDAAVRMAKNLRLTKDEKIQVKNSLRMYTADDMSVKSLSAFREKL